VLRWRLLSSAILISVLSSLVWADFHNLIFGRPGVWLIPLTTLLTLLGVKELLDLLAAQNLRPVRWTTYSGTLLIVLAAFVPALWKDYPPDCPLGKLGWPLMALAGGVCLAFCGEMLRYRAPGGVVVHVSLSLFVMVYLGLLMSFLVELRLFHDNAWGMAALVSVVFVTKLADAGAYATGRLLGRHKMTPLLSPKKTIEGAVGGLAAAALGAWVYFYLVVPGLFVSAPPRLAWWQWLAYGLILGATGMIGDLAESLIKRDMDSKDSSRWLPGLGGVLDIVDSLLFAAPPAYLCWAAGLVGP
jgi:phosphatidate cytidylyltransferase